MPFYVLARPCAVPVRNRVICHPIEDMSVTGALDLLFRIASEMYEEGPGSVTPDVYWYHDGQFTMIPCDRSNDRWAVTIPEKFRDLLEELAETRG